MQQTAFRSAVIQNTQLAHYASNRLIMAAITATFILAGCSSGGTRAPVVDMSSVGGGTAVSPSASGTHIVKPGETLYKIALAYGMETAALAQLNNISDPTQLRVGQVLKVGGSGSVPQATTPSTVATAPTTTTDTPPAVTPVAVPPQATVTPTSTAPASDANLINWGWPSNGKVIQGFNELTKGVDIEGVAGDPVHAAADGKVMYTGNGIRGLGNLILLGHSDGFITAYAHNQALLVKAGDIVKKGAKIATVGQTETTTPRLHFEVRRRGTPVDPMAYLPKR